jgi:hypothetical protein
VVGVSLESHGCLVLIKSVRDIHLNYIMSIVQLQKGAVKKLDQRRHGFLWTGKDIVRGSRCLVPWDTVLERKKTLVALASEILNGSTTVSTLS